jgi:hypothetical protein
MKRLFFAAMCLAMALTAHAPYYADQKHWKAIIAKAEALPMRKYEINDGTKEWKFVGSFPVRNFPVYRCTAEGKSATATFINLPTAQNKESSSSYALFPARRRPLDYLNFSNLGNCTKILFWEVK